MDKENQRLIHILLRLTDIVIWLAAVIFAYLVRRYLLPLNGEMVYRLEYYLRFSPVLLISYMFIYQQNGLYDAFRRRSIISEVSKVVISNVYGLLEIFLLFFWFKEVNISRLMVLVFCASSTALSAASRAGARLLLRSLRQRGYNIKHLIIVGCNDAANQFFRRVVSNRNYGYVVDGYLDDAPCSRGWNAEYLGEIDKLDEILRRHRADEVIISLDYDKFSKLSGIIEVCETQGIKSSLLPFYNKYLPSHPQVEVLEDIPIINLRHIPLDNLLMAALKRSFDLAASFFGLILVSPILLAAVIGIKLTSPGPIVYKQLRIGRNRKVFTMYKLRSMRVDNNADSTTWGTADDPRRTRFGAFLRKFSIDELPQLINVLKGDMSLVGPRPERPFFVERFRDEVPLYMLKHLVRPGITGWAQINGWRGDTSILERVKCDMYYIENWSFLLDIKILVLTVFKGIINPNEKL